MSIHPLDLTIDLATGPLPLLGKHRIQCRLIPNPFIMFTQMLTITINHKVAW